jgi:hypothetical protein
VGALDHPSATDLDRGWHPTSGDLAGHAVRQVGGDVVEPVALAHQLDLGEPELVASGEVVGGSLVRLVCRIVAPDGTAFPVDLQALRNRGVAWPIST